MCGSSRCGPTTLTLVAISIFKKEALKKLDAERKTRVEEDKEKLEDDHADKLDLMHRGKSTAAKLGAIAYANNLSY